MAIRRRVVASLFCAAVYVGAAMAQTAVPSAATGPRVQWPAVQSRVPRDAAIEERIGRIISRMSVEEKVGQIVQADMSAITPEEVKRYKLGSVLAGGNSSPGGNERAKPAEWLDRMDAYWQASVDAAWAGEKIP